MTSERLTRLDYAIAAHLRAAMATRTPAWSQMDLVRASGMRQSTVNALLAPRRGMTLNQLSTIADALGLSAGEVMDSAAAVVAEHEADILRSRIREVPNDDDGDHSPNDGAHRVG